MGLPYDGCYETPNGQLRDDALKHYESLASECCHWNSVIPKAINFYYDEPLMKLRKYLNALKAEAAKQTSDLDSDIYKTAILAFDAVINKIAIIESVTLANVGESCD